MKRILPGWLAVLALIALLGCARQTTTTEERAESQRRIETRLEQLRAEIDTLNVKSREAGAELKADLEERIRGLEAQRDSTERKLTELKQASDRAWDDMKAGTDRLLERLESSIAETREKLKSRADST